MSNLDDLGIERQRLADARILRDGYTEAALQARKEQADAADEILSHAALIKDARKQSQPLPLTVA